MKICSPLRLERGLRLCNEGTVGNLGQQEDRLDLTKADQQSLVSTDGGRIFPRSQAALKTVAPLYFTYYDTSQRKQSRTDQKSGSRN